MIKMTMVKATICCGFGLAVVCCLLLLISQRRVLIWESLKVENEEIECWYFSGRGILKSKFTYADNNFFGIDACRFLIDGEK